MTKRHARPARRRADETPMEKTTLRLPAALMKRAKHWSVDADVDLQDIVAEALRDYLAKRGAKTTTRSGG